MALAPRIWSTRRSGGAGVLLLGLSIATLMSGCGKSSPSGSSQAAHPGAKSNGGESSPRSANGAGGDVAVIKGWADALREGHPQRAAAYWAHPSAMVNGVDVSGHLAVIHIDSEHDALIADETLPCGATLRDTTRKGDYIQAVFTLSIRTGAGASSSGCSGPAAVDFLIRDAHIVRWLRAPIASGAPGSGEEPGTGKAPGTQSI